MLTRTPPAPASPTTSDARAAYTPVPSISRLIADIAAEEVLGSYLFPEAHDHARTAGLLRAVVTDLFALADETNVAAAADAANIANAVRRVRGLAALPPVAARAWVRQQYRDWEYRPASHPYDCPGGCGGTGEVLETLTWQGDGVGLHQEPAECDRGEPAPPHASDCVCTGTGRILNAERAEFDACFGQVPQYEPSDSLPPLDRDPWSEPPF